MKNSSLIVVHIFAVCLCLCMLSGCKTSSHTISSAETHRSSHLKIQADTTICSVASIDTIRWHTISLDSVIIRQFRETVITNTVDTAGNLIGTNRETNNTTIRDHYRHDIDQTSNTHATSDNTVVKHNSAESSDSAASNNIVHEYQRKSFWDIALSSFLDGITVLALILLGAVIIYYTYLYIKGK